MRLKERLMRHSLFKTLLTLEKNPRACTYLEPLWGIPYALYTPFASMYMNALGVSDAQIGYLISIGAVFQVIAAIMGGVLTDKLGRRLTTIIFDLLSWSVPCLIWAFAQNFWWFAIAAVFNSMWQITNISWSCLLVEDADPDELVNVYTWIHMSGLLAVFFAPISSWLISRFDLVVLVRALYINSFVFMTLKFVLLYVFCGETRRGLETMRESRNISVLSMVGQYRGIIKMVFSSPQMRLALFVMLLATLWAMPVNNYFSLYVTQNLGVSSTFVPIFPMIRAALMLVMMFTLQSRLNRYPFRPVMLMGLGLYAAALAVLMLVPQKNLPLLICYVVLEALAAAIVMPRKDSLSTWMIDEKQRARVTSVIYVVMLGVTAPFGSMIGLMAQADRRLAFLASFALLLACAALIAFSPSMKNIEQK